MTPRRRIAAATLGAALLGGTLVASPATAQQREFINPMSTPGVPSDLDIAGVSADVNRSTVSLRLSTQNLGEDFQAVAYVTQLKTPVSGKMLMVQVTSSKGTTPEVKASTVTLAAGNPVEPVDLPAGTARFARQGDDLVLTAPTSALPWSGAVHVGGYVESPAGTRFLAESYAGGDPAPTFFGPVTTAADATSTALSLSASRQVHGQARPVTLTAKVPAGVAGTVTFRDGATALGTVKAAGGVARLTVPRSLRAGTHTLTAIFTPTDRVRYSTSTAATWLTVSAQRTTTSLRLSKAKQAFRGKKPARATITVSGRATGTVTVYDGRKRLKTVRLSGGRATYTLPRTLKTGRHSIKAVYRPAVAGTYAGSTSRTLRLTVTR